MKRDADQEERRKAVAKRVEVFAARVQEREIAKLRERDVLDSRYA